VSGQPLLPEELHGRRFYEPTDRGLEAELGRRVSELRHKLDNP
jgi:replication-associated recombination protein RarA